MCEETVCEHVLEERRASMSSTISRESVVPPLPRPRRRSSAHRRASFSSNCSQDHHQDHQAIPRTSPVPEGNELPDPQESRDSGHSIQTGSSRLSLEKKESHAHPMLSKQVHEGSQFGRGDVEAGEGAEGLRRRTWSEWSSESIETGSLVPALVTQALATGLLDATTYADFNTFASNQTGNAILLTLSAVGTLKILLVLTAVSFSAFLGGAFVFGHVGHYLGVRKRAWLLTSTTVQTLFLVIAAILLSPSGPRMTGVGGKHEWVIILLFGGMSGAQVAMARQSSCQELPTAPMTSTFVDFVADHYLFASWGDPKATSRNRRLYYVIAMIGGSFIGAVMHRYSQSWIVVIIAVGVKLVALSLLATARPEGKPILA